MFFYLKENGRAGKKDHAGVPGAFFHKLGEKFDFWFLFSFLFYILELRKQGDWQDLDWGLGLGFFFSFSILLSFYISNYLLST